jgi:regulator of protease activity HflC (stomatin/prohibitin superfamily)
MFLSATLVIFLFVILKNFVIIVHMRETYVVERLGTFRKVLQPGLHLLIPFVDRVAYRHEIREQVIDIPPQNCITRDNIQVSVDGIIYLKVVDAHKASYGIGDYRLGAINMAQTTMRSEIGKLSLDDTFAERERLNDAIVAEIDKASEAWGIKVLSYELKNIIPSSQVIHTLEKQMEAEREKRAEITLANAAKESKILVSEGFRQESINLSEGEKQKRVNIAKGRAREIQLLAEASAHAFHRVGEAIQKPGGHEVVKLKILESYLDNMQKLLKDSQVSIFPGKLADVQAFAKILGDNLRPGTKPVSTEQDVKKGKQ